MDKSNNTIATRTRSNKHTTQQSPSEETKKDIPTTNMDINETDTQQPEMKEEQFINPQHSTIPTHHIQESLAAEVAQKEKIIEEQQQMLIQLQLNVQELIEEKRKQQHHGLSLETNNHNNNLQMTNNTSKYDNFIEQQLLKDKINNIRKFSGNKYDDVDEWLQNIELDFSSTLVSEEIKLKIIPKSLTNDAKNWFEQNKHRLVSWQTFKMEIQHRFQSSLHKDQKFTRLRERKQQPKETGQQFIDAMEKLCFQVNSSMMEEEKMLHIKAGLKPSLKEKVLDKQPQSMHELRNTIKRTEDIETMLHDGNNNEHQIEQSSLSSNVNESVQDDNNCYAISSHYNNPYHRYYRRNNPHYQYQQQQETNRQSYRPNQNYQTRNNYHQQRNQHQPNDATQTRSYTPSTTNNNSKKY